MSDKPDGTGLTVDIVLRPEWAARAGTDKDFYGTANNCAFGAQAIVAYTVPAGKTLYITQISGLNVAAAAADADLNQICEVAITDTVSSWRLRLGGNGGAGIVLNKPIVVVAGTVVSFECTNYSNHNTSTRVTSAGYEV